MAEPSKPTLADIRSYLAGQLLRSGPMWASAIAVACSGLVLIVITPHSPELRLAWRIRFLMLPVAGAVVFTLLKRRPEATWARRVRIAIALVLYYFILAIGVSLAPLGHGFFTIVHPGLYPFALAGYGAVLLVGLGVTGWAFLRGRVAVSPLLPGRWHVSVVGVLVAAVAMVSMAQLFWPDDDRQCQEYEHQPGVRLAMGSGELMAKGALRGRASVYQVLHVPETGTVYASFKFWSGLFFQRAPEGSGSAVLALYADGEHAILPFPVDEAPEYLAYDPPTKTLYVSSFRTTAVSRLYRLGDDGGRLTLRSTVDLEPFATSQPGAVAVDVPGRRLLLWDDNTSLLIYSIGEEGLLERQDLRRIEPDLDLWVWDYIPTGPTAGVLTGLLWPDTHYDAGTGKKTALARGTGAIGGAYDPSVDRVAIADIIEGVVRLYDADGTLQTQLDAHVHPRDATPLGRRGWVAAGDYVTGRVTILDASDGRLIASRETGGPLRSLVYDGADTLFAGTSCGVVTIDLRELAPSAAATPVPPEGG